MYGAIYKCKMCGKEFPYVDSEEKKEMEKFNPTEEWIYTLYGPPFPEYWILGIEKDPPQRIPHYCNNDSVGCAELIGFTDMAEKKNIKRYGRK